MNSTAMTNILAGSTANKTSNGLNNVVMLTDIKRLVNMLARQLYAVSGDVAVLKKGTRIKVGWKGQREESSCRCVKREIFWHRIKNAHSSHRPLEMECYQTGGYAPLPL